MKITDVRTIALSYGYENPIMSAGGMVKSRDLLLVLIETDTGLTGIGEASTAGGPIISTKVVLERELRPLLLGADPFFIEKIWQEAFMRTRSHGRRGLVMHALSGVDIALWDLIGKATQTPVYKLLGAYRNTIQAYASGGFYQRGKGVQELVTEMENYVGQGYTAFKMKIGRNLYTLSNQRENLPDYKDTVVTPEEDITRIEAVRKVIGNDALLMVDANCAWSPAMAITMGKEIARFRPYWLEEPVLTDDVQGSAEVARALGIPIAGYETETGLYGFRDLIINQAVDIVQPSVTRAGGISECRKIAALAAAHHIPCFPHAFSSAVTLMATLHFAASLPHEVLIEYDQNPNPLREELLLDPLPINRGWFSLPDRPGLGIELNEKTIARYQVDA